MYWYKLEGDIKKYFVKDIFVKNPDEYFGKGIEHWTHINKYGIIDAYGPKKHVEDIDLQDKKILL